jgi:hypothetical protein
MEYRSAHMVELHDSGYIIVCKDYPEGENGWREFPSSGGKTYTIRGEEIARLLKYIDVSYYPITFRGVGGELPVDEFAIEHGYTKVGDRELSEHETSQIISSLLVCIEGPQLLHIKATLEFDDAPMVKHITYSGRFTVWWADSY